MKTLPEGWEIKPFIKCIENEVSSNKFKIPQSKFLDEGKYAVIDQSMEFIAGYTNDSAKIYKDDLPVIIFGDHTRIFKFIDFPFALGADGTKILVPKKDMLNPEYFYFFLKGLKLENHGYSRHYKFLKEKQIILPPLPTQKKIAAILEKAERLKEWRKEADRLTDEFLKSTLLEMFDRINNDQFEVKELKDIIEEFRYGTSKKSGSEGFPVLGIPNVLGKELIVNSVNRANLSESEFEKLKLKKFDLLFVRSNGNPNYIGRCGIFNLDEEDYVFASYLIRARVKQEIINPYFLKAYLETSIGRRELRLNCRTTAGQFNINTHGLGSIKIPIPSIKFQNKFAQVVQQVKHLRDHQSQSKQQIDDLFNALMQQAFKGELAC